MQATARHPAPRMNSVLCVLPARLGSTRIPRKPLRTLAGRPLVEWTWRAATAVPAFDDVWVATDSEEVADRVRTFGGRAVLTSPEHASGTDRVAEAAGLPAALGYDIVVNFQTDEPFADREAIGRAVASVREGVAPLATVAAPLVSEEEWRSEATVKVVTAADGRALYFSRAPIPHLRGGRPGGADWPPRGSGRTFLRHVGVYVANREALGRWVDSPRSRLEQVEGLEQLRALEAGLAIQVVVGAVTAPGVDEPEDLDRAARLLEVGPNGERHV